MKVTRTVRRILDNYESDSPGVKANLARILMQGKLGGTGKMVILPVDQGFEHGPARSFAPNPAAYDPHYHFQLAIDAGLSAYAAPMGMIEAGADTFAGQIPTILKVNSSNSLAQGGSGPSQAITGSVSEALRLGCSAIGYTIYPGSDAAFDMMTEFQEMAAEAKALGLAVVLRSYPRGGSLTKEGETAFDIDAYAAHMAALLGAHIIKVKPPTDHLEQPEAKKMYEKHLSHHQQWQNVFVISSSPALTVAVLWSSQVVLLKTQLVCLTKFAAFVMAARQVQSLAETHSSALVKKRLNCLVISLISIADAPKPLSERI